MLGANDSLRRVHNVGRAGTAISHAATLLGDARRQADTTLLAARAYAATAWTCAGAPKPTAWTCLSRGASKKHRLRRSRCARPNIWRFSIFRRLMCPSTYRLRLPRSGRKQEAPAEEIKARAAKHLAFQHL